MTKLRRGATYLLSTKMVEEKIMVKPIKPITKGKQNIKRKCGKAKELNPMPRDLNLGYPTCFSLSSWAVKTVVSFPRGD